MNARRGRARGGRAGDGRRPVKEGKAEIIVMHAVQAGGAAARDYGFSLAAPAGTASAAADPGAEAYAHLPNFLVVAARREVPARP